MEETITQQMLKIRKYQEQQAALMNRVKAQDVQISTLKKIINEINDQNDKLVGMCNTSSNRREAKRDRTVDALNSNRPGTFGKSLRIF